MSIWILSRSFELRFELDILASLHLYCTQYAFNRGEYNKGLFPWKEENPIKKHQEDPRLSNNVSLGLQYAQISVHDYSLNNVPLFYCGLSLVLRSP